MKTDWWKWEGGQNGGGGDAQEALYEYMFGPKSNTVQ